MAKLFLLRHLKSQWNEEENRFTGWVDVCLQEKQQERAKILAEKIFANKIDAIYSSSLFRNMDTIARILEYDKKYPIFIHLDKGKMKDWGKFVDLSEMDIPIYVSEKLNERYYGKLQGENKAEAIKKYGEEKVHLWRRSYDIAPPGGESLKDVVKRTTPFYKKYIEKNLKEQKNTLIVASHNALRAIVKHVEKISNKDIVNLEIPFGGLIGYELDESLLVKNKLI
jgi:2,3-bisphosphoglycerate-dependent phosphoglycerate mutase